MTRGRVIALSILLIVIASGPILSLYSVLSMYRVQCQSGNEFRRLDKERWDYIVHLSEGQTRTPPAQKQLDQFVAFIEKADRLRDCSLV